MKPTNDYIFGPVPSRRLGLSLGIDLVPFKTCSYDCIYCQVGRTTNKTIECKEFFPVSTIIDKLKERLEHVSPDVITFSGSGEPTLYSKIDVIIKEIRKLTDIKLALLTNGSLLWREDIRKRVLDIDIIMPTITTTFDDTFKKIHRPHSALDISTILDGLVSLRREYNGAIYLELFLLAGINDNEKELLALRNIIDKISADKIQINTVVRPPSDRRAISVDIERLKEIKDFLGETAEIIADVPRLSPSIKKDDNVMQILNMIKRRPVRDIDIANAMGIKMDEVRAILKGLLVKGMISMYKHLGETYYKGRVENEQ